MSGPIGLPAGAVQGPGEELRTSTSGGETTYRVSADAAHDLGALVGPIAPPTLPIVSTVTVEEAERDLAVADREVAQVEMEAKALTERRVAAEAKLSGIMASAAMLAATDRDRAAEKQLRKAEVFRLKISKLEEARAEINRRFDEAQIARTRAAEIRDAAVQAASNKRGAEWALAELERIEAGGLDEFFAAYDAARDALGRVELALLRAGRALAIAGMPSPRVAELRQRLARPRLQMGVDERARAAGRVYLRSVEIISFEGTVSRPDLAAAIQSEIAPLRLSDLSISSERRK